MAKTVYETLSRGNYEVIWGRHSNIFNHFYSWVENSDLPYCLQDPSRFLNSDETGFDLNPTSRKVLTSKGVKNVYKVAAMYTFSADGNSYKPQLTFRKGLNKIIDIACALGGEIFKKKVWFLFISFSFRMRRKLSYQCIRFGLSNTRNIWRTCKKYLVKELDDNGVIRNARNHVFYFLDGHKSRYNNNFILWCRENFIIILTIFLNATESFKYAM